jgi:hypothetical protein
MCVSKSFFREKLASPPGQSTIVDWPGRSVSELDFCVAKLTIFYKPFAWIAVGECFLS